MKKTLISLAIASVLAGCSAFPDDYKDDVGIPDIEQEYSDAWSHELPIRYVQSSTGASVSKYFSLPEHLAQNRVSLEFSPYAEVKVRDLIASLRIQGYNVVSLLSSEDSDKPLLVRNFDGPMIDFVEQLSHVQNIAYEYRNNTIFILDANRYSVSLPQHQELLTQVAQSLVDMGAFDVRTDLLAGMVYFNAKPDISDYITEYLDRIAENTAMVRLQIAVVTVGLNRDVGSGLDWASIMAQAGTKDMRPGLTGGVLNSSLGSGAGAAIGQMLNFTGASGLGYILNSENFSLSAAVKALSTYGNARTEQNVVLGTVSGMPVRISSGNDIPYVKSIGSSTSSGGSVSGSTETETIRSGLEVEVIPNFDSSDNSVVTTVKVNMSSLVGFRELSAGANLGTLSQPEMQNLEFENVGRLSAGETVIIGGITYDQLSNAFNNLPGMENLPIGSKSQTVNKNAIYIVLRPTVIVFTRNADELNKRLKAREKALLDQYLGASAPPSATTQQPTDLAIKVDVKMDIEAPSESILIETPHQAVVIEKKEGVSIEEMVQQRIEQMKLKTSTNAVSH